MIIGVTGLNCAGKDTIANYLIERGFYHLSLSDVLRAELRKRNISQTRENLITHGNQMRSTFGPHVLADLALRHMDHDKNYVVTSIRNPAEVKLLSKRKDFLFINVKAPVKLRFERGQQRAEERDKKITSFQHFKDLEAKELRSPDPNSQQLLATTRLAEVVVSNDKSIEQLHDKLGQLLKDWLPQKQIPRPQWDQYFMDIAKTVATRSNCMKRKVAAVIVKDKRIISTGYNGTPRGVKNCNEGGCPRCNSFAKSGTGLQECYCSHGEENAIVQASYHGASLSGATLYSTFSPCLICTKMIINSGIIEVIYNAEYPLSGFTKDLMRNAGISLRKYSL